MIISKNLSSAALDPEALTEKLQDDLRLRRVIKTPASAPYICSPLGLVPKHDGGLRRIHHLSHPAKLSVNDNIPQEAAQLKYTSLNEIYQLVVDAGRGCIIIKKDVKDAFRNIPVAPQHQWLLGFEWQGHYYKETCLPFGLATAPFLFNLFAEALHWMMESYLSLDKIRHYLDDFIIITPPNTSTGGVHKSYKELTDLLGVPRNDSKDAEGTTVIVL